MGRLESGNDHEGWFLYCGKLMSHAYQEQNGKQMKRGWIGRSKWLSGKLAAMSGKRFRVAAAGLALLCVTGSASADQFYYSRVKAGGTGTGDEGATTLVRWDDATGTQTLLSTFMSHATDGRVSVPALATNGATLYGLVSDDTSTAPLIPYNSCTAATCRSRLVIVNPANGVVTYVGAWLNGYEFGGAGFDPSGRLWATDNLTGDTYRLDPASGAIIGTPIQTNLPAAAHSDIDFTSNGLGIIGHGGFTFVTFDPNTGAVGVGSFSATNSGFDGTLVPPYAVTGLAFTTHLVARNGSAAATTCRINVSEGRGLDELGHVNDPWSVAAPIARKEANQLDPPTLPANHMNGGPGDMARVGGPAFPACILDFGDAPNTFATLLASNGARHQVGGPLLGTGLPDIDINGVPNATASGDDTTGSDDENGVTIPALGVGQTVQIQVQVGGSSAATRLQGWIDWARDNSFAQAGDRILTDATVTDGLNTLNVVIPANAVTGTTYARFRIANQAGLGAAGVASSGEVEDYQVQTVQPSFGSCSSNMYLGVGAPTQLHRIDTSTNPLTYPPIGAPDATGYNAMGYDPASNYIFATRWDTTTSTYRLLRIGSNGSVLDTGAISGGGINAAGTGLASGEIGADGFYYVKDNNTTNQMWRVNLGTRVATLITLSQSIANADLAWSNGQLYAHDQMTGLLNAINPTTGVVTTIGPSGFPGGGTEAFGSMIGASNGIFGRHNSGGFYKFDTATGQATLISDAPAGGGDGAKCVTTPVEFPVDLAITKTDGSSIYTPGNNVTYTIVVSNNGPFGVQNAQVTDPLPTGITTANWTCGSATGGATCGAASGTGAINTTVNLPANGSVIYSLTLFAPSTFSGNLVNAATVTAPTGSPDANTANNTASDTDTQFPLPPGNVATISCISGGAMFNTAYDGAGGRLTSGADNYWQVALTTTPVTGAPPVGLTYAAAQVATAPPPSYIVSPYGNANWISNAADALHPGPGNYDIFYRFQFNIAPGVDPTIMALDMQFYADNSVFEVWVNGNAQGVHSNYGAADPYFYAGFVAGGQAAGVLNGPWLGGLNEIVVHVKSGPGAQAFLAQVLPPAAVCAPAAVALNKTSRFVTGGPFGFGLTNTSQAAGTITTATADAPNQVDGNTATAGTTEPFSVATFGSDVVITESSLPAGWLLSDATCTSDGIAVGSRAGSAYTIPGSLIDSSAESFECTFTNTPTVDLRIDKTAAAATVESGDTVAYTITLNNDGPGPGDGAVIRDPAISGVDCSAGTLTCGNATGGAVCPASPTVTDLQGSGVTIPTFPAGGSMQFTLTCTVTATGAP